MCSVYPTRYPIGTTPSSRSKMSYKNDTDSTIDELQKLWLRKSLLVKDKSTLNTKSVPLPRLIAYPLISLIAVFMWVFIISCIVIYAQPAKAHGGRTNQYGCHNNNTLGKFECHSSAGVSLADFDLTDTQLVAGAARLGMIRKMHSESMWCYVYWRPISDTQFTFDSIGTCERKRDEPSLLDEIVYPAGTIATGEAVFDTLKARSAAND